MFQGISIHQNQDNRQEDEQNMRQVLHQVQLVSAQNNTIYTQLNIHCQFYMKYLKFKTRLKSYLIYIGT